MSSHYIGGWPEVTLLDTVLSSRFWWWEHLPTWIADEAVTRVAAEVPSAYDWEDAFTTVEGCERIAMMWLAAVEAVCSEAGTTLEDVADIF